MDALFVSLPLPPRKQKKQITEETYHKEKIARKFPALRSWREAKCYEGDTRARSSNDEAESGFQRFPSDRTDFWGNVASITCVPRSSLLFITSVSSRDAIRKLPPIERMADSLDVFLLFTELSEFVATRSDKPRFPRIASPPTFCSIGACSFLRIRNTSPDKWRFL